MKLSEPTFLSWKPNPDPDRNIAVMMSGGVDSSVAALLLKQQGWNVVGITMKIPTASCDIKRSCCGIEAAYVCKDLEIPHYYLEVTNEFNTYVIEPFRQWYLEGKTPSPCVDCNTELKFKHAWNAIKENLSINHLATGHYAQILNIDNDYFLARGVDKSKDQSYFLYGIEKEKLPFLHFPLGGFTKSEIREIAYKSKMPVAKRTESMELCFSGEKDYRLVLGEDSEKPGDFLDVDGNVIGMHKGIAHYTIGQRKGIGIAARVPYFVISISKENNTVTVGKKEHLYHKRINAECVNILIPSLLEPNTTLYGKIRSQGNPLECKVISSFDDKISVEFIEPQFAPTNGQRLVLYDGKERVVAGGVITN
ncbi:MAG: tRNA 2-thiouridine(34) synthase MnmA [Armatimonadota bacterium]